MTKPKIDDIVTLVVDEQEIDARVERVYDDQPYIDVRTLEGGPHGNIAYQFVGEEAEGSIRYFRPKTAAEKKAPTAAREEGTDGGAPRGGTDSPTPPSKLPAGAKPAGV